MMVLCCNADPNVHGILIYYPCFGQASSFYGGSMDDYLRDSVPIEKDVEGLCHTYRHNLYHNIRYVDTTTQKYKGGLVKQTGLGGSKKCVVCATLSYQRANSLNTDSHLQRFTILFSESLNTNVPHDHCSPASMHSARNH